MPGLYLSRLLLRKRRLAGTGTNLTMGPLPPINYLRLSVTDRCNLRCVYCT